MSRVHDVVLRPVSAIIVGFKRFFIWNWDERRGYVMLTIISMITAAAATLVSFHQIDVNNHKFCQVITPFTSTKVTRPANPKANPSREQAWEWYERYVSLGRSLGC